MTQAAGAVAAARSAIARARVAPTPGNLRAARAVVAAARSTHQRADGPASPDGKGYNPYRSGDGEFAPGPHKKRPAAAKAAKTAAPALDARGTGSKTSKTSKPASGKAKAALDDARAAVVQARKSPTEANIAAAKEATSRARVAAGAGTGSKAPAPHAAPVGHGAPPAVHASGPGGLAHAQIKSLRQLGDEDGGGMNSSFVATLGDGSKAVWKPASGESRGMFGPLRSNIDAGTYYKRETAAYKLAEHMGMKDMVPETATVMHGGQTGSLQRWHQGAQLLRMEGEPNGSLPGGHRFGHEDSERMRVFDYVIGNSDRHAGNVLADSSSGSPRPILIDHGLAFPKGSPDQFIQPTEAIHESSDLHPNTRKMIDGLDIHGIARTLHESGIEPEAVRHTLIRVKALQGYPEMLGTPWSGAAHDAWDQWKTPSRNMVSAADMQVIDGLSKPH